MSEDEPEISADGRSTTASDGGKDEGSLTAGAPALSDAAEGEARAKAQFAALLANVSIGEVLHLMAEEIRTKESDSPDLIEAEGGVRDVRKALFDARYPGCGPFGHPLLVMANPLRDLTELVSKFFPNALRETAGNGFDPAYGNQPPPGLVERWIAASKDLGAHTYGSALGDRVARDVAIRLARKYGVELTDEDGDGVKRKFDCWMVAGVVDGFGNSLEATNPETGVRNIVSSILHPSIRGKVEKRELRAPAVYSVDPVSGVPDFAEMEELLKANRNHANLYICNPANPSGHVLSEAHLQRIGRLAIEYGAVVTCDEIYSENVLKEGVQFISFGKIAAEMGVPAIVFNGASKMLLMGGARVGWMMMYNFDTDDLKQYKEAIFRRLQDNVCAPGLGQKVLSFLDDPEYKTWNAGFNKSMWERYENIAEIMGPATKEELITLTEPQGAMYTNMVLNPDRIDLEKLKKLELPTDLNLEQRTFIETELSAPGVPLDKILWCHLLARGVAFLPLSGFAVADETGQPSSALGFRGTLLQSDPVKRMRAYGALNDLLMECKRD